MLLYLPAASAAPLYDVDEASTPLRQDQVLQLAAGSGPGTFLLRYRGRVRWAAEPERPVVVTLRPESGEAVARTVLEDTDWYVLQAELSPGTWGLRSDGVEPWSLEATYWGGLGPQLHVDEQGRATCVSNCGGIWHALTLATTSPQPLEIVPGRPTLTWEPVPGATGYLVRWFERALPADEVVATEQNIRVQGTSWTFPEELPEGRLFSWQVEASGADGQFGPFVLAHGGSAFLTPGAELRPASSRPEAGTGYLGARLIEQGPPFRPVGEEQIAIMGVVPGTAAQEAGLRPGDVVEAFDGAPVASVEALIRRISECRPGTQVTLTIRRGDSAFDVAVALGARPPVSP